MEFPAIFVFLSLGLVLLIIIASSQKIHFAKINNALLQFVQNLTNDNNALKADLDRSRDQIHSLESENSNLIAGRSAYESQIREKLKKKYEEALYAEGVKNLNLQQQIDNLRWAKKKEYDPDDPIMTKIELLQGALNDLERENQRLSDQNMQLITRINKKTEANAPFSDLDAEDPYEQISLLNEIISKIYHGSVADLQNDTWGEILSRKGKDKFDLSEIDLLSIHYPIFNPKRVFYASATGRHYHSVSWCYTLNNSDNIKWCSQQEAVKNKHLFPCSKCIDLPV